MIWRGLLLVFIVIATTEASRSGPAPGIDVTGCRQGGFVLGADHGATITTFRSESSVVLVLKQVVEFKKPRSVRVSRDFLVIHTDPETAWVSGCRGGMGNFSDIVVVLRRPIDYSQPEVLVAWKVNRETWKFERLNDPKVECRLIPPPNCARDVAI